MRAHSTWRPNRSASTFGNTFGGWGEAGIDVITLIVEKWLQKHVMWVLEESGTEVRDAIDAFLANVLTD